MTHIPIALRRGAAVLALGLAFAIAPHARAERDIRLLMTMDHTLVDADLIAVIEIDSAGLFTSEAGRALQNVVASIDLVAQSRWSTGSDIEFNTDAGFEHFGVGSKYLVLMSGGAWSHGPFTHRENSVFEVLPSGELVCSGGDLLYGVLHDGFFCAPKGTVYGNPLQLDEVLARIDCLRSRAVVRLPALAYDLDKSPRKLELDPSSADKLQVRR